MIEPPDLGALIRKVLPQRANRSAAADQQVTQLKGEPTTTAPNSTTTKAA
jgi:hypothetical protein